MQDCPIQNCGRKFPNQQALLQHGRRRHPEQYKQIQQAITKSVLQNERHRHQELHKLPRLNQILTTTKTETVSEKPKVDIYRRSSSKNKPSSGQKSGISTIISDSRRMVDVGIASTKRPSIKKNSSQKQLNESSVTYSKLPDLNQHKIKNKLFKGVKPINVNFSNEQQMRRTAAGFGTFEQKQQQNFYTTTQGFGKRLDLNNKKSLGQQHKIRVNSKSKDRISSSKKIKSKQKTQKLVEIMIDQTKKREEIAITKYMNVQQKYIEENEKSSVRPLKKGLERKKLNASQLLKTQAIGQKGKQQRITGNQARQKNQLPSFNEMIFEDRTVILRTTLKNLIVPSFSKTEYLFLNNCSLNQVDLNGLQSLITLSLCHNNLTSMDFLKYGDNQNIENVYLDYNKIEKLVVPPNLKVLGISFNRISNIDNTAYQLKRAQNSLEQIDLSFNPIRKEYNYKVHILSSLKSLKKIDGIKVTKIDKEMAEQFKQLLDQRKGILPLNNHVFELKMSSPYDKDRPSTAFTTLMEDEDLQIQEMSAQLIQKDIESLEQTISQTQNQLNTIKTENRILLGQMKQLQAEILEISGAQSEAQNPMQLYEKLRRQCQALQVLNFMQYADQQQLQQMIIRKRKQKEKQGIILV